MFGIAPGLSQYLEPWRPQLYDCVFPWYVPYVIGALLDINGDGVLDVVGSNYNTTPNPIPVVAYLGNGTGLFTENNTVFSPVQPGQVWQRQYLTADFNDDGKQDLFIADHGYDFPPYPGARNWLLMNENGDTG